MDTAAINPSAKTTFWDRLFGAVPTKGIFNKQRTKEISKELANMIAELNGLLFAADEVKTQTLKRQEATGELATALTAKGKAPSFSVEAAANARNSDTDISQKSDEYVSRKIEALHRNIMRYKDLFRKMSTLADGPVFLLLDDLYHIRLSDQADVLDYLHRIAKGSNLWIKVGTIRHSRGGTSTAIPLVA
jgi:hypothetical protein